METKEEISLQLDERDKRINTLSDELSKLQTEKHNKDVELLNLTEGIRQLKMMIRKLRTDKELLERAYWRK